MQCEKMIREVLGQLTGTLQQLSDKEYKHPSRMLSNASIGQHVRHVVELFMCLFEGYETGTVNYDERMRDQRIETDRDFAIELIQKIINSMHKEGKELMLESHYESTENDPIIVPTNYYRELIYNLEHTVHHMALMRVGINDVTGITVPDEFGVAASTLKYRRSCAQ